MDKTTAGLLGAVAGLATMGSAQAAVQPAANPTETLQAASYAELLAPVSNAVEALKADDAVRAQEPAGETWNGVQLAQAYYYGPGYGPPRYYHHHHHHHHHAYYRHHHHHHHHSTYVGVPGLGGVVVGGR